MRNVLVVIARGLLKRCPRCGRRNVFESWFTLPSNCPRCGLQFEREEGAWLGSMAINLGVTELLFGALVVSWVAVTWPDIPVVPLLIAGISLNALFPLFFYPFAKTIWAGIDLLLFRMDAQDVRAADREWL